MAANKPHESSAKGYGTARLIENPLLQILHIKNRGEMIQNFHVT